jgi:hypothetical protein
VEERGALEMAHRTLQYVGQVFRYATANGRAEHDITADLRGALISPNESLRLFCEEGVLRAFWRIS